MKNIDVKSLLIGALLTSTIFLGVAAADVKGAKTEETGVTVTWREDFGKDPVHGFPTQHGNKGWEPFAVSNDGKKVFYRHHYK
tara:strand:- start:402 stop:650 length:249 start_codon:yes stop_codon:yes gene_type:complete